MTNIWKWSNTRTNRQSIHFSITTLVRNDMYPLYSMQWFDYISFLINAVNLFRRKLITKSNRISISFYIFSITTLIRNDMCCLYIMQGFDSIPFLTHAVIFFQRKLIANSYNISIIFFVFFSITTLVVFYLRFISNLYNNSLQKIQFYK